MRIYLDPGHGGYDNGAVANGLYEKTVNLAVALWVRDLLTAHGVSVLMARTKDIDSELTRRTAEANAYNADAYVSIHHNAGPETARGVEVYHTIHGGEGKRLAELVYDRFRQLIPELPDRGLKTRKGQRGDYYHVIRETTMPAVLIEGGFLTNPDEARLISTADFQEREARAIAEGVLEWGGIASGTPILGQPEATLAQAREFVRRRNLAYVPLAALYYEIAPLYGIRPDGALAQACKETGFFAFGGDVVPSQYNFAGLGATGGGVRGASFDSWEQGVHAHVQHLYCYASKEPLPAMVELVDPRWNAAVSAYGRGSAPTWEALGGKWAPSPDYGKSIVNDYLADMVAIETAQTVPLTEYEAAMDRVSELEAKLSRITEILEED